MTRIERVTSPLPRECSTTEPHGHRHGFDAKLIAEPLAGKPVSTSADQAPLDGAGNGNRTRVISLEG
jgi:hypothetical protein